MFFVTLYNPFGKKSNPEAGPRQPGFLTVPSKDAEHSERDLMSPAQYSEKHAGSFIGLKTEDYSRQNKPTISDS